MNDDELRRLIREVKDGALALVLSLPGNHPRAELLLALDEMTRYCDTIREKLGVRDDDDTPN